MNPVNKLFDELYAGVKELIKKNIIFDPTLKAIKSKLDSLKPVIPKIAECNDALDIPKEELEGLEEVMKDGMELVLKCSKIHPGNYYKRYKYANKLLEWDESLQGVLSMLNVQSNRDVKTIAVAVGHIEAEVGNVKTEVGSIKAVINEVKESFMIQNHSAVVPKAWCALPELPEFPVGIDEPLSELKMKLLKNGVSRLVLTAPGGCGKTTLATKFCQDKQVKDKFKENIFFITISKRPNLDLVVQELRQSSMGSQVPTFESEVIAVRWLQEFLKGTGENPLLLVLDDVWPGSESLLQKFDELKMPNYKILVTSRYEFPGFGSPHILEPLNYVDAMALFHDSASLGDKSSYVPKDLPRKIVECCKGFPLAITVVGRSLCEKPTEFWLKRVRALSKGASVLDSSTDLLICLQSSLHALDEEDTILKDCFLDLGSFPEGKRIPASALIDIWAELYELNEDFLSISNLQELATRSLVNLIVTRKERMEVDGYYSEHFVTQHDLLRQLAIYETKLDPNKRRLIIDKWGDNLPKCLTEQRHQPIKTRLLSISSDGVFSTTLNNIQLSEVEVLVLNFSTDIYALPEFVAEMENLKVLIVTNHGSLPAKLSNFQLLDSLPNLKRIRLERISIPSIAKNPVNVKSLKKISLFMCSIGQVFSNSSFRISYAFPNLEELNIDYCSDLVELPVDLCDLIELRKLSITHCHSLSALPDEIGKLIKLEVLRLKSCTDLKTFPASIKDLEKLNFLDISDCFSIKELPDNIGEISTLEKINMRQCSRVQDLPLSVMDLKKLKEVICDEEKEESWALFGLDIQIRVLKEEFNLNWLLKLQY
ncbi:probable disease resistance protein At5g66900 [Rosa rugosa]|uniref:probable disease resistance protein At5g66900 n=1 Tax=Rosa rugosa TaxID=74645 RepID=UPI002B403964|nr:probable disease resistance protein At5g66900 [Rosa rugosa]